MRFVILKNTIEYWQSDGQVTELPKTPQKLAALSVIVNYYRLIPQRFDDRIMFTEFLV